MDTITKSRNLLLGAGSFVFSTGITIAAGFIMAGVLARYFNPAQFGLWTILMSLNGIFINGFDWGFGNALRNRIAQLATHARHEEARIYFFHVFIWFLASAVALMCLFGLVKPLIPWGTLFNTSDTALISQGSALFVLGAAIFSLNIAFNLYTAGFFGYQESHINAVFNALSKLLLLGVTLVWVFLQQSFYRINLASFLAILVASILGFLALLCRRAWRPRALQLTRLFATLQELWRKSAQFALLQVFSTILLSADLFILSKVLGLVTVGDFFLVKRLYVTIATLHLAVLMPFWSAYTAAIESGDVAWASRILRRTMLLSIAFFMAGIVGMVLFGEPVIYIWAGKHIHDLPLIILLGIWSLLYGWNNCFSVFLNATGNLKWQVIWVGLGTIAFFPLGVMLSERYGSLGIGIALIIISIPVAFSNPLEARRFLRRLAHGQHEKGVTA